MAPSAVVSFEFMLCVEIWICVLVRSKFMLQEARDAAVVSGQLQNDVPHDVIVRPEAAIVLKCSALAFALWSLGHGTLRGFGNCCRQQIKRLSLGLQQQCNSNAAANQIKRQTLCQQQCSAMVMSTIESLMIHQPSNLCNPNQQTSQIAMPAVAQLH